MIGAPPERPPWGDDRTPKRSGSVVESLNYAFEGIIHVLRTQRNMQIHFAAAFGVLVAALFLGVSRTDLMILIVVAALVIVAEMVNTAIEAAVDLSTTNFDPRAKIAKDVAAGAVLIISVVALGVAYLVLSDRLAQPSTRIITRVRDSPLQLSVIALVLVVLSVIVVKAATGRGTPVQGGLPSGHTAIAFSAWAAITFIAAPYVHHLLISTLAFLMAALVGQTRVESGVHSGVEVVYGAVVGALVTLVIFQAWS